MTSHRGNGTNILPDLSDRYITMYNKIWGDLDTHSAKGKLIGLLNGDSIMAMERKFGMSPQIFQK